MNAPDSLTHAVDGFGTNLGERVWKNMSSVPPTAKSKIESLLAISVASALSAVWTAGAWAQTASPGPRAKPQEQFSCLLSETSDRREIGIYRPARPQRCRVDYTRDGKTRSLWSSGHDYEFCVRKALEVIRLLEGINFKCSLHSETDAGSAPTR